MNSFSSIEGLNAYAIQTNKGMLVEISDTLMSALDTTLAVLFPEQKLVLKRSESTVLVIPEFNPTDEFCLDEHTVDDFAGESEVEIPANRNTNSPEVRLLPVKLVGRWFLLSMEIFSPDPDNEWEREDPSQVWVKLYGPGATTVHPAVQLAEFKRRRAYDTLITEVCLNVPLESYPLLIQRMVETMLLDSNVDKQKLGTSLTRAAETVIKNMK